MEENSKSAGYNMAIFSVAINLIIFLFKFLAGYKTNSVAMVADAWHTLSDSFTSFIVIIGFWMAFKPADKKHPFGHGRAESIASLIIGIFLSIVAFNFLKDSVERLQSGVWIKYSTFSIIVFFITALIKEILANFSIRIGRKINSPSLITDGWHHRSDALASLLIVAGALSGNYLWWIDGAMGAGVSFFILYIAYRLLRNVISSLLGEEICPLLKKQIEEIIKENFKCVSDVHHFHIHRYGEHVELTFHIMLPSDMKLKEAHDVVADIEEMLRDEMKIESTIHIDPADRPCEKI